MKSISGNGEECVEKNKQKITPETDKAIIQVG